MDHLTAGLRLAGLELTDLTGIVITHFHSDHLGMAARIRAKSGAWVALGDREIRQVSDSDDPAVFLNNHREELTMWGVPVHRLDEVAISRVNLSHLLNLAIPISGSQTAAWCPPTGWTCG